MMYQYKFRVWYRNYGNGSYEYKGREYYKNEFWLSEAYILFVRQNPGLPERLINKVLIIPILTLVTLLNLYLLICLAVVQDLKKSNFLLVAWQATCDLVSVALCDSVFYFAVRTRFLRNLIPVQGSPVLNKILTLVVCHVSGFSQIINEYSTFMVLWFFAIERFILIVVPFKAKTMLTDRFYKRSFTAIVILDLLLWSSHSVAIATGREPCSQYSASVSFWYNKKWKFWGELFAFFIAPAVFCIFAYSAIAGSFLAAKLRQNNASSSRKNSNRKVVLTLCFFSNTLAWIIVMSLFSYAKYLNISTFDNFRIQDTRDWGYHRFVVFFLNKHILNMISIVNPLVFVVVNRKFQKPLKAVCKKLSQICSWNR